MSRHDVTAGAAPGAAAISSIAAVAARHLPDLVELSTAELPQPLADVGAPPGWRLAQMTGAVTAPARMLVCGQRADGTWDGCDTIRAFAFTGHLDRNVVHANADCTLRSLAGENITAGALAAPPAAVAVRASGYFTAGRRFWAQFSAYVAESTPQRRGLLLEHSVMADAGAAADLGADIARLSDTYHHAFINVADHAPTDDRGWEDTESMTAAHHDTNPNPGFRHFRYDATGLHGKRMRITDDLPTSDSGRPQEVLIGITDVICLDDTPGVLLNLRVHPVGQPDTVAVVEFTQLAIYDDQ